MVVQILQPQLLDQVSYTGYVGSAVQASLRVCRFSPTGYILQPLRLHFGNTESALQAFIFIIFYLIIAWNAKT
jgi:hypothetical protein